jgi:hypothetical protein
MKSLKFKGERKMHNEFLDYLGSLIASEVEEAFGRPRHPRRSSCLVRQEEGIRRRSEGEVSLPRGEEGIQRKSGQGVDGSFVLGDVKTVTDAMRVRVLVGIDDRMGIGGKR